MKKKLCILLGLWLCGCSIVKPEPVADTYVLKSSKPTISIAPVEANLRIARPDAAPGLDTSRIAVLEAAGHLTYYTGIAWAQPFPLQLQSYLIDSLQQSGSFTSISSDRDGIYADLVLLTDIRDAEVENVSGQNNVHIAVNVKLVDANSRKVLSAFRAEQTEPVTAGTSGLMNAFNACMHEISDTIIKNIGDFENNG